jgi:hypothetical protein
LEQGGKIPNQTSCISKDHRSITLKIATDIIALRNVRIRHKKALETQKTFLLQGKKTFIKRMSRGSRGSRIGWKWSGSGLDSPPSFASRAHQEPYDELANELWLNTPVDEKK